MRLPFLSLTAALLCLLLSSPRLAAQPDLREAGVCARCHVVSVLEWSMSAHREASANCRSCHGASEGHVENERNEVKPDRARRGETPDGLCRSCHMEGCPSTQRTSGCLDCHHQHALVRPGQIEDFEGDRQAHPLVQQRRQFEQIQAQLEQGERLIARQDWQAARDVFQAVQEVSPSNPRALAGLKLSDRRLDPEVLGFEIVGDQFDVATGLPREVRVAGLGIAMVLIPSGEFDMGSEQIPEAQPVHTVQVEDFYLGEFELTQPQWEAVMGANPSTHRNAESGGALPIETISWSDAQAFITKLNEQMEGGGFRLPTEAEWEYAARAGAAPLTSADLARHAWFRENSLVRPPAGEAFVEVELFASRPVGGKEPNAWGLFDIFGNVWEWTSSLARPYPYQAADGRESPAAAGLRILRGGGYADPAFLLDPALRHAERSERRYRWNGLRVARSIPD